MANLIAAPSGNLQFQFSELHLRKSQFVRSKFVDDKGVKWVNSNEEVAKIRYLVDRCVNLLRQCLQ